MKKIITLSLILLSASILTAQESPFEELDFALWPEYDHTGVLVLMEGTLRQDVLPVTLAFRIPDDAATVGATFSEGDEEIPLEVPIEQRTDGKWAVLEIAKSSKILRTGFYYNPFTDSAERNIEYILELNQPLDHFHIQVQEPLASENFRIDDPKAQKSGDPTHGFTSYTIHVDGLSPGEQKPISFSYRNPSGQLSMEVLQQMMAAEPPPSSGGAASPQTTVNRNDESFKHNMPTWQPLLILAVVALIIGVIYATKNKYYCPKCKTQLSGSSKFCSSCGAKL